MDKNGGWTVARHKKKSQKNQSSSFGGSRTQKNRRQKRPPEYGGQDEPPRHHPPSLDAEKEKKQRAIVSRSSPLVKPRDSSPHEDTRDPECGDQKNTQDCTKKSNLTSKSIEIDSSKPNQNGNSTATGGNKRSRRSRRNRNRKKRNQEGEKKVGPRGDSKQQWVSTGAEVSALYSSTRKDHLELHDVKTRLICQANYLYQSGNKGAAVKLHEQARELMQMESAGMDEAREAIFLERNPGLEKDSTFLVKKGVVMIDMHGLYVKDAIWYLDKYFGLAKKARRITHFDLLCGTGHHSSGRARLGPGIKKYLRDNKLHFRLVGDRQGVIRVEVPH